MERSLNDNRSLDSDAYNDHRKMGDRNNGLHSSTGQFPSQKLSMNGSDHKTDIHSSVEKMQNGRYRFRKNVQHKFLKIDKAKFYRLLEEQKQKKDQQKQIMLGQ